MRLAVTIRDKGERPVRLRRLTVEAEAVLAQVSGSVAGGRIISLAFLRSRTVADARATGAGTHPQGWASVIEYRARMLSEAGQ